MGALAGEMEEIAWLLLEKLLGFELQGRIGGELFGMFFSSRHSHIQHIDIRFEMV